MSKAEFEDLYKFAVSVGVALVLASLILPWLVLREPFDLGIGAATLAGLTPEARVIVSKRLHAVLWVLTCPMSP